MSLAIHRRLAEAPSVLITATLEDALGVAERPNLPGTTGERRANWSLALPMPIEGIETDTGCERSPRFSIGAADHSCTRGTGFSRPA